jgi:hypothetical protein
MIDGPGRSAVTGAASAAGEQVAGGHQIRCDATRVHVIQPTQLTEQRRLVLHLSQVRLRHGQRR